MRTLKALAHEKRRLSNTRIVSKGVEAILITKQGQEARQEMNIYHARMNLSGVPVKACRVQPSLYQAAIILLRTSSFIFHNWVEKSMAIAPPVNQVDLLPCRP